MVITRCAIEYPRCFNAAACVSGGTTFVCMLAQEYLEGQSCKKKSLETSKNRQIITFTLALVARCHTPIDAF